MKIGFVVMLSTALAVALIACDKKALEEAAAKTEALSKEAAKVTSNSNAKLKAPPQGEWKGHFKDRLQLKELPGSQVWFYMGTSTRSGPLNLKISTRKLPVGTTLVVGDKEFKVDKKRYAFFDLDLSDRVGQLPIAAVYHKRSYRKKRVDLELAFKLTLPGYKALEGNVPPVDPSRSMARFLREVEDGALKFKGEPEHSGKIDTIATAPSTSNPYVAGRGKKISDIDLVVVPEVGETQKSKVCRFKRGPATISFKNAKVSLYNRHTGEKIAEDTIKNKGRCPMFAMIKNNTGTSRVARKEIEAWAKKALAKYRN